MVHHAVKGDRTGDKTVRMPELLVRELCIFEIVHEGKEIGEDGMVDGDRSEFK